MYHSLTAVGNVGREVEMRYLPDGTEVASFSLAVNKGWGEKKTTLWIRVSCWRKLALTVTQYLHKGDRCLVVGELSAPHVYQARDGQWKSSLEMTASEVRFLSEKGQQEETPNETVEEIESEETPFF